MTVMNCNIVKDLIPLYIDDCCSDETSAEVKKHVEQCEDCKKTLNSMKNDFVEKESRSEIKKCTRTNYWKASVMQSVLFLFSFLLITVGVYFEANIGDLDYGNCLSAFNIVVPATGFMLSLVNWYFVRLYKNRKLFSRCSCALSFFITLCAFAFCAFHYETNVFHIVAEAVSDGAFFDFLRGVSFWYGTGIFLTVIFTVASKILSDLYAKMLGKE